ncbi:MAG: exodeoxyribonuclease III, partial [Alphaproteobacteria bacterium]|nr:exodeoxyribonuclease III [Alphaproteobacteria bacterium]
MLIATWNIAGIKARLGTLLKWIEDCNPDIICLQETKSAPENFPFNDFETLGYQIALNTQPQFNGVAILTKEKPSQIVWGLATLESNEQARLIKITINNKCGDIHLYCLYAPNGNPLHSEKYIYKLNWLNDFYNLLKIQASLD